MQNHISLLYREEEREMLPLCIDAGIGLIPWSPMARGRLTRPYGTETNRTATDAFGKVLNKGNEEEDRAIVAEVEHVARVKDASMAQVALAWVLQKSPVSAPIIGATKLSHISDAVGALSVKLTPEEVAALEAPYRPRAVSGFS